MTLSILVDKEDPLVDEEIRITVTGLQKKQCVTIRAEVTEKDQVFAGSGCFVADENGVVDVSRQPSIDGTYKGISPMGLFWSMRSSPDMPPGFRLIKNNASSPLVTELTVFLGHISFEVTYNKEVKPVLCKKMKRWYMAKGVQKVTVRTGRLRGALFIPPGKGPFPGVIDMFGIVGALVEFRAALLASRGFTVLALPYFLYDDLPKDLSEMEFEYFVEAVDWFSAHPHVDGEDIGVIGVSKGGEIALHMGYYCDKVKSVITINGAPFLSIMPMMFKGETIGKGRFEPFNYTEMEEGISAMNTMDCEIENYLPIWEKDVSVLLISGEDDMALKSKFFHNLYNCYPSDRKHLCELLSYPGAGHLIEPLYAPLARASVKLFRGVGYNAYGKYFLLWGGETVAHAHAQEHSWKRILEFLRKTLSRTEHSRSISNSKL